MGCSALAGPTRDPEAAVDTQAQRSRVPLVRQGSPTGDVHLPPLRCPGTGGSLPASLVSRDPLLSIR
ncbi:Hypothetical predicted protein [Marmota monax]|uniref:Uncharacterized protein n=1 Tax=Marmota monax TaxID=9995 RepID=A0A5E4BPH7_MARMO|nr:hypothetical protein GHT09_004890 [Marmota monax]VTJ71166.1 Hypothetical predicted protein [Marmota monax]